MNENQIKTIKYLLNHGAKVFLVPSYGNPVGNEQYESQFSTEQFMNEFEKIFFPQFIESQANELLNNSESLQNNETVVQKKNIVFIPDIEGLSLPAVLNQSLQSHSFFLFENILFYSEKQKNLSDPFHQNFAKSFDIYIQDDPICLEELTPTNLHLPKLFQSKCIGYSVQSFLFDEVDAKNSHLLQNGKLELNDNLITRFPALIGLEMHQ